MAARGADLTAAAEELAAAARTEPGCLGFDVLAPPGGPSELVLLSAWRGDADMRKHFALGAYGRYVSASPTCCLRARAT